MQLRLAAGPAYAAGAGAAAFAGAELRGGSLLFRLEGRGTATGRSADWEGSARVLGIAVGGGIASRGEGAPRYLASTIGAGIDPREADHVTTWAVAVGSGLKRNGPVFVELRYERWWQRGVRHHELPDHLLTALLGLTSR